MNAQRQEVVPVNFSFTPVPSGLLQRKCACGNHTMLGGECEKCSQKKRLGLQTKLTIKEPGDIYEQEADRIADQVLASSAHPAVSGASPLLQRFSGQSNRQMDTAPASVDQVLASPGRPLEPALRQDMEQRFGHDFSQVRVHSGAAAEQSARDVNANAYTVGHNMVFGAGRFTPGTYEGRRLIAHELTHVVQQSGAEGIRMGQRNEKYGLSFDIPLSSAKSGVVQRQPADRTEAYYQRLVKQGKWCRDSEKSGQLHPGQQCYREIPPRRGYPPGDQVCFSKVTGQFVERKPGFYLSRFRTEGRRHLRYSDGDIPIHLNPSRNVAAVRSVISLATLLPKIPTLSAEASAYFQVWRWESPYPRMVSTSAWERWPYPQYWDL